MKAVVLLMATLSLTLASCDKAENAGEKADDIIEKVTSSQSVEGNDLPAADAPEEAVTESAAVAPAQAADTADGEAVYRKACASCHMTGAAGAPKTGDEAAWSSRVSRGIDALVQSALAGVPGTAMMARGACAACSDEEIEAAVRYMTDQLQ
jgi:cytochrome c5